MSGEDINALDQIVKRQQPYQPGQHVFRAGDQSHALFVVRSGCLKTYCTTEDGNEQVLGFTLPGELVGLDGMGDDVYASNSIVLETASICELPYDRLEEMCHSLSGLNHQLMRLASKEITSDQEMQLLGGTQALYDSRAMRTFVGIDLGREPVPDETPSGRLHFQCHTGGGRPAPAPG